ncbi:MAG: HNH endonuclease [Armatimonadetes bacterium]|nr:HNH endonuclease [Armatimonadota bacterium]MDW8027993.1 HNH endonuclease signature motif containing protein [Armatimonadota bacterium]
MSSNKRISANLKRQVFERAKGKCEYCLSPATYSVFPFEADHIIPRSKGGSTSLDNLALSCGCHRFKAARTYAQDPKTGKLVRLFNPRKDRWDKHFCWSKDLTEIEGLTAIGRATVEALKLNRKELVWLRMLLIAIGEHPKQK